MDYRKLNILVVDDRMATLKSIFREMDKGVLKGQYELIKCTVVEEIPARLMDMNPVVGLETIQSLKDNGQKIDIAFVDRGFDDEYDDIDTGPRKIINAVLDFSPECQILLLTASSGNARNTWNYIEGIPNLKFRAVAKSDEKYAMYVIHDVIKDWTVNFLRKEVSRCDKDKIMLAVKNNTALPVVNTLSGTWLPETYLIPYFLYREQKEIKHDKACLTPDEISGIVRMVYQPKLKSWHASTNDYALPLSDYYEKYLTWPERSEEKLNRQAEAYLHDYLSADKHDEIPPSNTFNFQAAIKTGTDNFSFVQQLETILIGRRIGIALYLNGFSEKAIWFALRQQPMPWSRVSEEERDKASPTQLFSTFFALSLRKDIPDTNDASFESYENLLYEEISWLKTYMDLGKKDAELLKKILFDAQEPLKGVNNNPLIRLKPVFKTFAEAEVILTALLGWLNIEGEKDNFIEDLREDMIRMPMSPRLKEFLEKFTASDYIKR